MTEKVIEVKRKTFLADRTLGELYIDGDFFCYTLEDLVRPEGAEKVYGETAIPYGTYNAKLTWSNHFNKVLPQILDVPNFGGVRLHGGNSPDDTLGCVLVGFKHTDTKIYQSASAALTKIFAQCQKDGINVIVKIEADGQVAVDKSTITVETTPTTTVSGMNTELEESCAEDASSEQVDNILNSEQTEDLIPTPDSYSFHGDSTQNGTIGTIVNFVTGILSKILNK